MSAVQKIEPQLPDVSSTPPMILADLIKGGAAIEVVREMRATQEWWDGREARKAFDLAIADAKAEIPPIIKNREVDFTSQKGRTHYRHEDLAEIARTVDPILARHGLSYRYRVTSNLNEPVTVTCVISHRQGHFEETTLCAGRDESGNKNSIQAVGSTVTYLQRYTLKAALGLSVAHDDDGRDASAGKTISADEAVSIRDVLEMIGDKSVEPRLLKWLKVERIEDIPADRYDDAMDNLKKVKRS